MDSTNSGSMQSSSGGDEDQFNSISRGERESISSFLNSISTPHQQDQNPNFFDPHHSSHNLDHNNHNPFLQSSNATTDHLNWSSNLRSETNFGNLTDQVLVSSPRALRSQYVTNSQLASFPNPSPSAPPPQPKNPKKRTRASRRAPTTVLTTDPANFRQMVQEFTGIPSVPLSGRLDLFSGRMTRTHLDQGINPLYPNPFRRLNSSMIMDAAASLGASSSNNNFQMLSTHDGFLINQQKHDFQSHDEARFSTTAGGQQRNGNDGVEERFDENNIINNNNTRENMNMNMMMSGYSLNLLSENTVGSSSSVAVTDQGNNVVASWISPSD